MIQRPYRLAPEFQALFDIVNTLGNDLDTLTRENLPAVRAVREARARHGLRRIAVERVRDFLLPGGGLPVPVRLYVPIDKRLSRGGKLPLLVFFHGGGWVLGSINSYDSITRYLAAETPAMVLSVDYRLAPEHPFPAAVDDAKTVWNWLLHHAPDLGGDPARLVVAGDSAGATLAIAVARHARNGAHSPALQCLFYPSTNISSTDYDSYRQYGEGYLLTERAVRLFRQFYLPVAADRCSPNASPLLSEEFRKLPTAMIVAAGCDPLRDEGLAYANRLRASDVEVDYYLEGSLPHAFLNLFNLEPACSALVEEVLRRTVARLRERLG